MRSANDLPELVDPADGRSLGAEDFSNAQRRCGDATGQEGYRRRLTQLDSLTGVPGQISRPPESLAAEEVQVVAGGNGVEARCRRPV
jgi:hypothetical protein